MINNYKPNNTTEGDTVLRLFFSRQSDLSTITSYDEYDVFQ